MEFFEALEEGAYDLAAEKVSAYREAVTAEDSPRIEEEQIEVRRETRESGEHGPGPGDLPLLDEQTGRGGGPVTRIWCEGETVPTEVWRDYVKIL